MCCGLGEEERTKIRKKKKEKKEKKKRNKPHRGQKWVGWDERVSWDIQPYEIFFAVLKGDESSNQFRWFTRAKI